MTDTSNTTKTVLSNVLGLKNKPKATVMPPLTEAQVLEEAMRYSVSGLHHLREELEETKAKLVATTSEYQKLKTDAEAEAAVNKYEWESKLAMARAENMALRNQLTETGAKLEHYSRKSHQFEARCDDYEKFFSNSIATIYDAGQHQAVALASTINTATSGLHEAVKHSTEGLLKQLQHVVDDAQRFLADLKKESASSGHAAYQPTPRAKPTEIKLDPQSEQALEALINRRTSNDEATI
jgi:chromosome segregation ATPase